MKVFVCTDHDGHWPVGVASVIVAPNEEAARALLRVALKERWLNGDQPFTLKEIDTLNRKAYILRDGDY